MVEDIPEWVADDEEGYVEVLCIFQDIVAAGLDELAVRNDDFSAIVGFLLRISVSSCFVVAGETYEDGFVDEENAGVGFEVDARRFAHNIQSLHGNIGLISEAESYEVKHLECGERELFPER